MERYNGIVSALVVLLSFLAATALLLLIGKNPVEMYQAILQVLSAVDSRSGVWNVRYTAEWLVISVPLILCALSVGISLRSGLFNLGAEGQYIAGLTAAQFTAFFFPRVPVLHAAAAVCIAVIAGAAWGGIAGILKTRYKISEVISTVMMNYIALYIHRIITMRIPGSSSFRTPDFPVTASLSSPLLSDLTNGSKLNNGLWIATAAVFIYWVIMEKSRFGYSLRSCGVNADTGVNSKIIAAMAVSGSFAGLAGVCVSLGMFSYGRILTSFENYGFEAMAVAIGSGGTTAGITIIGLLFGLLKSAQPFMQSRQIPKDITTIIMALVVVFFSFKAWINIFAERKMKKNLLKEEY